MAIGLDGWAVAVLGPLFGLGPARRGAGRFLRHQRRARARPVGAGLGHRGRSVGRSRVGRRRRVVLRLLLHSPLLLVHHQYPRRPRDHRRVARRRHRRRRARRESTSQSTPRAGAPARDRSDPSGRRARRGRWIQRPTHHRGRARAHGDPGRARGAVRTTALSDDARAFGARRVDRPRQRGDTKTAGRPAQRGGATGVGAGSRDRPRGGGAASRFDRSRGPEPCALAIALVDQLGAMLAAVTDS